MQGAQIYREGVVENEQARLIFQIPLVREITIALLVKVIVIFFIKWQFFSDPVDITQVNNSPEHHLGIFNSKNTNLYLEKTDG